MPLAGSQRLKIPTFFNQIKIQMKINKKKKKKKNILYKILTSQTCLYIICPDGQISFLPLQHELNLPIEVKAGHIGKYK